MFDKNKGNMGLHILLLVLCQSAVAAMQAHRQLLIGSPVKMHLHCMHA